MNVSLRPRVSTISRRKVLAALAAPLAAPLMLIVSSIIRPDARKARAQAGPAPVTAQVNPSRIRAHQAALPFAPGFGSGKTRLTLSSEDGDGAPMRLPPGPRHTLRLVNELPHAIVPRLRGIGAIAGNIIAPGASADLVFDGLRAGTHLLELRGLETARALADKAQTESGATNAEWPVLALIVAPPSEAAGPDPAIRDELLLIEEWPGGTIIGGTDMKLGIGANDPGGEAQTAAKMPVPLSANRLPRAIFAAPAGGTLRLRIINATPRHMLSLRLPDFAPVVIAIDGEDSEPFPPQDRQIMLAPGNRMDVRLTIPSGASAEQANASILVHDGIKARAIAHVEIVAPAAAMDAKSANPPPAAPQSGQAVAITPTPARPNLAGAQRIDLAFAPPASGSTAGAGLWRADTAPAPSSPAFTAAKGRTVSLALRNDFSAPVAFHLTGHRARLLDRLDDGWKPFWLDTIAVEPNETIRLAFVTPNIGIWDIEATLLAIAPPSAPPPAPSGDEKRGMDANGAFRFVTTFSVI